MIHYKLEFCKLNIAISNLWNFNIYINYLTINQKGMPFIPKNAANILKNATLQK